MSILNVSEPEHFDARKAYLILRGKFMEKLIKQLRDYATGEYDMTPVCSTLTDAAEALEWLTEKLKVLEKVEMYLKTNTPEESGYYFIAGALGEVDQNCLPKQLLICPAYGCDWMQFYERTDRTTGPEY
jgi:hypothetical protein